MSFCICKGGFDNEQTCGRPLGMRMLRKQEKLIVIDADLGLFTVHVHTGQCPSY